MASVYTHFYLQQTFSTGISGVFASNRAGVVVNAMNMCDFGGGESCAQYLLGCDSHF